MKNYIKTKLLSAYFTALATLPDTVDRKRVFLSLAKMYGVGEAGALFSVCESKPVRDIDSGAAYNMHERMKKIPSLARLLDKLPPDAQLAVTVKGQAYLTAEELKIKSPNKMTADEMISRLAECANEGIVAAMTVYGFALYEGHGVPQNKAAGLRFLQKAVRWNCTEAAVMCMTYDPANAQKYADVLMSSSVCPYVEATAMLAQPFGVVPQKNDIAVLLEKAFSRGLVKREKCEHAIVRILYCTGLSFADKQNAILSCDRDYILAVNNFPLNLCAIPMQTYAPAAPLGRTEECGRIAKALKNSHLAAGDKYRPLLLSVKEKYLADAYIEAIKGAFTGFNTVVADAVKVEEALFENGAHNVVIKELSEKKPNLVLFRIYGAISPEKERVVKIFLSAAERRAFKVAAGLKLDLSDLLPIVVCDRQNTELFKRGCRVIEPEPLNAAERAAALSAATGEHARILGLDISVDDGIWDRFANVSIDHLLNAVDAICMSCTDDDCRITYEKVQDCLRSMVKPTLGFRGGDL